MIFHGYLLFNGLVLNQFCSVLYIKYVTIKEMGLLTLVQAAMFLHSFLRVIFLFNFFLLGKIFKLFFYPKNFFLGQKICCACRLRGNMMETFLGFTSSFFKIIHAHCVNIPQVFCGMGNKSASEKTMFSLPNSWYKTRGGFRAASKDLCLSSTLFRKK